MSIPCPKLRALVEQTQKSYRWVELLEDDLKWLVTWNNEDETAAGAAAGVLGAAKFLRERPNYPTLRDNADYLNYSLEILRLSLRALWPYVEEAPEEEFDVLLAWYNVTLVWADLPRPQPDQVPLVVSALWEQVANLRTLEKLRELAKAKGLWLLKNDIAHWLRYQVVVPGRPTPAQCYKDAARLIEAYPDNPYSSLAET
jgi:hypothetical protein